VSTAQHSGVQDASVYSPTGFSLSNTWLPLLTPAIAFGLLLGLLGPLSSNCQAQSAVSTPNATVTPDTLEVHTEMATSSEVVGSLKKGDAVIVDFEIKTTEKWCSVRMAGQADKMGFVQCQNLARQLPKFAGSEIGSSTMDATSGGASSTGGAGTRRAGKDIGVAPPPVQRSLNGYSEIAKQVVRDDVIDINKLAELDGAAKNGSATTMTRAALGHYAAANFELSRNSPDEALDQFQASLNFAKKDANLQLEDLMSIAYVHMVRSEYSSALEYLDQARKIAPQSAAVAAMTGTAYYRLDRLPEAVEQWKLAQKLQPSPMIAAALERIEKDKNTETDFREGSTHHFSLHYQGNATPQLAAEILRRLEEHFRFLQTQLRFAPVEPISVVLYTQETFQDITRAPAWVGALNDGRIRVPIQGLTSVTDELSQVLVHELTHSFVRQKTLGRCPTWLNEGLAQYMEGRRSEQSAQQLVAMYQAGEGHYIPLHHLEGGWTRMPAPVAAFAYAWGLAATETIIANSGMFGLERFFDHLANESSVEPALRESLQTTYPDLERNTAEYLRTPYPR
jgi:tetratricopeptide (TPR) repeat protein